MTTGLFILHTISPTDRRKERVKRRDSDPDCEVYFQYTERFHNSTRRQAVTKKNRVGDQESGGNRERIWAEAGEDKMNDLSLPL